MDQQEFDNLIKEGNRLKDEQKYSQALKVFDKALTIKKECSVLRKKGKVLKHLKQYQDAIQILDESLKLDPKSYKAIVQKGKVLMNQGFFKESLKCIEIALTLKPSKLKMHQYRLKILRLIKEELMYFQTESEIQLELIGQKMFQDKSKQDDFSQSQKTYNPSQTPYCCDEYQGLCKICLDQKAAYIGYKCFHLVSCDKCLQILKDECPICRTKTSFKKIYL